MSIIIIELTAECGARMPDDPMCMYQMETGEVAFLTGAMITVHYRYVVNMVFPSISHDKLKLFNPLGES